MQNEPSALRSVRNVLLGAAVGALACGAVLLLESAAVLALGRIPQSLVTALSLAAAAVGAFAAGLTGSLLSGHAGLLYGFACAFLLFLAILIGGAIESTDWSGGIFVKLGVMLLYGMLGGVLGVNRRLRY